MSERSIENLIGNLTQEIAPVHRLAHPLLRIAPWIIFALIYGAAVVSYLGLRPDMASKFADPVFLFETGLMLSIALTSALSASWLCIPDLRGQKWLISVPITLTVIFCSWMALRAFTEGAAMPDLHWGHCLQVAMLLGFVPGAVMMFLSARGATTHPFMLAVMNVLSMSALGYVGLRLTCGLDTVEHSFFYHMLPFVLAGAIVGIAARRIFSW